MSPTSKEISDQLQKQEADYLKRLEEQGELPQVIGEAWKKAGSEKNKALLGQEATALTNYVGAAPNARAKFQDVWNPFKREQLVGQEMQAAYSPIASVRKELAMRAEALGLATSSSMSMYQAGNQRAASGVDMTRNAYNRALQQEQEAERKRQFDLELQFNKEQAARQAAQAARQAAQAKKSTTSRRRTSKAEIQSLIEKELSDPASRQWMLDNNKNREWLINEVVAKYGMAERQAKALVYSYFPDGWEGITYSANKAARMIISQAGKNFFKAFKLRK